MATLAIGIVWLFKGPTDQELLANAAKALDFHPWSGWWSASFLGGASQAPGLTTLLTYLVLKAFIASFGVILGSKLASLIAVFLGGLGVSAFLTRWTGDDTAAWLGGVAYILGPQMALRLAGNEHLPVVFSMVFAPWVLWALIRLSSDPTWRNALILAMVSAGMTLAFTKLAVVFAPLALLFAVHLWLRNELAGRRKFLQGMGHAALIYLPLAVVPLLPTLREVGWLAMFQYDPFAAWQQNFSLKSVISWLDRGNLLQQGMPGGFTADMGGFYVGVVTLTAGLLALGFSGRNPEDGERKLADALRVVFGGLLFLSWMSVGPRSVAQGLLEFLKSASGASDLIVPLFWIVSIGQCVILWRIWPDHRHREYARIAAILVYLLVPGFRVYELLPFAHDIRAPWSFWQVGGSLAVALLFGVSASLVIRRFSGGMLTEGALAVALIVLLAGDYSIYLLRYGTGALPVGTYPAFEEICSRLRQMPDHGNVYPISGRYFYLRIPDLTGKPIEQEAFNSYFGLSWRRALQGASMASGDAIRNGLSLLGCGYVFLDKKDPNTPPDLQNLFRGVFPAVAENEFFVVLANPGSLAPGFLANDFVALPKESYAMASAVLQLAPKNLITVELAGVDPAMPGYAGQAKAPNQIELLEKYQAQSGTPFMRLPSASWNGQSLTFQVPQNSSGWLVTTMAYHPDWTATIDGRSSETHRAEAALLSTYVPPGSREVTFQFKAPAWYGLSLAAGAVSWIVALAALLYLPSKWAPTTWRQWWVTGNAKS